MHLKISYAKWQLYHSAGDESTRCIRHTYPPHRTGFPWPVMPKCFNIVHKSCVLFQKDYACVFTVFHIVLFDYSIIGAPLYIMDPRLHIGAPSILFGVPVCQCHVFKSSFKTHYDQCFSEPTFWRRAHDGKNIKFAVGHWASHQTEYVTARRSNKAVANMHIKCPGSTTGKSHIFRSKIEKPYILEACRWSLIQAQQRVLDGLPCHFPTI